jgi:hypothetical protein
MEIISAIWKLFLQYGNYSLYMEIHRFLLPNLPAPDKHKGNSWWARIERGFYGLSGFKRIFRHHYPHVTQFRFSARDYGRQYKAPRVSH